MNFPLKILKENHKYVILLFDRIIAANGIQTPNSPLTMVIFAYLPKLVNVIFPFGQIQIASIVPHKLLHKWLQQRQTHYDLMVGRFGSEFMVIVIIRRIGASYVCLKPSLVAQGHEASRVAVCSSGLEQRVYCNELVKFTPSRSFATPTIQPKSMGYCKFGQGHCNRGAIKTEIR